MHSMAQQSTLVVGGVDSHSDTHHAAALDEPGALLGTQSFPTTRSGYRRLLGWLREFGEIQAIAVESTGSYAAALVRFLREHDITAVEVNQPHESSRLRWCNGWGARRRKMRCTGWRDVGGEGGRSSCEHEMQQGGSM